MSITFARTLASLVLLVLSQSALANDVVLDRYSLGAASHSQWALPEKLVEISALAMTPDDRLLAVDDERAVVFEIDYINGGLVKAFALDKPVLRGDFEGLAVFGSTVYLMTSNGDIFAAEEGEDGERVTFERHKTKLGDECEFEGLAADESANHLLLLCKNVRKKADIDTLSIFAWDIGSEELVPEARIELPIRDISMALRTRRLHPSGLVVDGQTGHLLLVAAREQALIELERSGKFIAARRLTLAMRHPQAEGIELAPDGRLILSDEGGKSRGRLSLYDVEP